MDDFAPPTPNRDHVVTFRVTASELIFIDELALQHLLTRAQLIREIFAGRIDLSDRPEPAGPTTDIAL